MEITTYLEELSSKSPAPGGGSAAALTGAISASLNSMVAQITAKKHPEMAPLASKSQEFRDSLLSLMQEDTRAFLSLMEAYRSKEPGQISEKAIYASQVPLRTAERCLETLTLAVELLEKGAKSVFTDSASAALLAWAGIHSALLNVSINLPSIVDEKIKEEFRQKRFYYAQKADELLHLAREKIRQWQENLEGEK
ncbi:MAG: cyclodeaminase/cyclohydrolase family protein [bacterium JZ-2024 1]